MSLEQLTLFLEDYLKEDISIYRFKDLTKGSEVMVEVQSSEDTTGGVDVFTIIINVKDTHPAKAEAKASTIIENLNNVTNKMIENYQLILISANYSKPQFLGTTENNQFVFCGEFKVMISKIF